MTQKKQPTTGVTTVAGRSYSTVSVGQTKGIVTVEELAQTIMLEERAAWGHFLVQLERLQVATDNANNAWDEYQAALGQMKQLAPEARPST